MPTKIEKDALSGQDTTGHEWDGVKELNTPLPTWWVYTFYATIVFAVVYCVLYPSWPWLNGHTNGFLGYSSRAELTQSLDDQAQVARRVRRPHPRRVAGRDPQDPELFNFALAGGRVGLPDNCMQCHGAGGAGGHGFPNLVDDDWLWGGSIDQIHTTIQHGVRNADDKSRQTLMPRLRRRRPADGAPGRGGDRLRAEPVGPRQGHAARAPRSAQEQCVACHQADGKGNQELGAPNLTDGIWLYGGDRDSIYRSIFYARNGSMPAWSGRLDEATIKMLTIYVHALGGGR